MLLNATESSLNTVLKVSISLALAFAGPIHRELPASFRIVVDRDRMSSFTIGAANLLVSTNDDDNLVVSSSIGNMEIKKTNESFVLESVPPPSDIRTLLETDPELEKGGKENEKYDIVNDKLREATTERPTGKFDCMDSPLKHLIVKCDGNIRLRNYTDEERAKAEEERKMFQEQMRQRMEAFRRQMDRMREMLEQSFQGMRSRLFGGPRMDDGLQPEFAPDFGDDFGY